MNFPAGILQPPFYDPHMDDAVNYGQAGGLEGHELTHGFDDEGRQFDGEGNFSDWWTPTDEKKFKERADCVVKQYDGFVAVDDLHVNGKLTLGENIADIGGVRLGYLAWQRRLQEPGVKPEADLDGMTPAQQFFTAYAQSWCSSTRPETVRLRVRNRPALSRGVPRQRRGRESARVSAGLRLQGRSAHGQRQPCAASGKETRLLENFRLTVFRAVAAQHSFRRAAEQLYLSQPAVTQQIRHLKSCRAAASIAAAARSRRPLPEISCCAMRKSPARCWNASRLSWRL